MPRIKVGYEVGTGREVWIPDDRHIGITGQTQRSGKTTTLEALISRASGCALAFITKRGEGSFRKAQKIPAFFYDPLADKNPRLEPWQFMISVLESKIGYRMQAAHRRIIIKTCSEHKGKDEASSWPQPRSLSEVVRNVKRAHRMAKARVESETYMELAAFMDVALPEIQSINPLSDPAKNRLELNPGLNVMDIHEYSSATQEMIIAACMWDIHKRRKNTKLVIPECQTFLPQKKSGDQPSLVAKIGEDIIRQGAAIRNLLLLDSQDMAGVDKVYVRGCGVFFFGVQREQNEIKRMLSMIPNLGTRINPRDIMLLKKGHFIVQYDDKQYHTYIQPVDVGDEHAHSIAIGDIEVESVADIWAEKDKNKKTNPVAAAMDPEPTEYDYAEISGTAAERLDATVSDPAMLSLQQTQEQLRESRATVTRLEELLALLGKDNAKLLELLKQREPKTENGIRTDVRTPIPEGERAPLLDPFPGAIPSQEGADAQGAGSDPGLDAHMTPAPPETGIRVKSKDDPEWHPPSQKTMDFIWHELHQRAMKEAPGILEVLILRPELRLKFEPAVLQADGATLRGGLALMIMQGFFDAPKNGNTAFEELKRLGRRVAKPNVYRELDKLAEMGFVTKESTGYQKVAGMKITK